MTEITKEQIEAWKNKHGVVYYLESDGVGCYIKDPLSSIAIIQKAIMAEQEQGNIGYTVSIINDCFLGGDERFKNQEQYVNGLADDIELLTKLPDYSITPVKDYFAVQSEGYTIKCKKADRKAILSAESKNVKGKPFQTSIYLLEDICLDTGGLEEIKKKSNRAYFGFLRATNGLKYKAVVTIKKL